MSSVWRKVAKAFSLGDLTLVMNMNLATALKERKQIENYMFFAQSWLLRERRAKHPRLEQTITIKMSICVFHKR
jgi:hypothetical protein